MAIYSCNIEILANTTVKYNIMVDKLSILHCIIIDLNETNYEVGLDLMRSSASIITDVNANIPLIRGNGIYHLYPIETLEKGFQLEVTAINYSIVNNHRLNCIINLIDKDKYQKYCSQFPTYIKGV